jgi:hypothetical protein
VNVFLNEQLDDLLRGADADLPASSSQPKRKRDAKILASPVKRTTHESEDEFVIGFCLVCLVFVLRF